MTRKEILDAAAKCVCGQREEDYGTPEDACIPPETVALMMALLKVARLIKSPEHLDSWVDLAGYAACGGEIAGARRKQ